MTEREYSFRFAERCLYEYQENVARLATLRQKLAALDASTSAHVQSFEPGHAASHGDPVAIRVLKRESLEEEISRLSRRTEPITRLMADLEAPYVLEGSPKYEMAKVARLYYFGKSGKGQTADKMSVSRSSLYRRRKELIRMTIFYLGL
jgi:hypothetical protein